MTNILIFGAGSMGTAFSYPCSDKNHSVTIIGTHLENNFIDEINSKMRPKGAFLNYFHRKFHFFIVDTELPNLVSEFPPWVRYYFFIKK